MRDSKPGDYWRASDGRWEIRDPDGVIGALGNHTVVEHEDGTISVAPSIVGNQLTGVGGSWHGFLERGVWRSA